MSEETVAHYLPKRGSERSGPNVTARMTEADVLALCRETRAFGQAFVPVHTTSTKPEFF